MKHFEFWHPRVFETPYYLNLVLQCLRYRLPLRFLAKANYALDHGEMGLGSKYTTQMAFDQKRFPPTVLLKGSLTDQQRKAHIAEFSEQHHYPVILKPDIGNVGKGVLRVDDQGAVAQLPAFSGDYLLQAMVPHKFEYGVFFVRKNGIGRISGINRKHFPTVVGNGRDNLLQLARQHPRYTSHWGLFLKYLDVDRVPAADESVRLSFVGSHTMGCMFTEDTHLVTPQLEAAINQLCASQPGFNFGRFDVMSANDDAFQNGEFVVIEVNGIASLPTNMFDPGNSFWGAYRVFLKHGNDLARIANEHRNQDMQLDTYRQLWNKAKSNHVALNRVHQEAIVPHQQ